MIKVEGIKKTFSTNNVLRGVSFCVDEGSIYGLIGRNGAGKTTLMSIMTGLMPADSGQCSFGEKSSVRVGYLPDLPSFYDYLTTDEYLDFLLMGQKKNKRKELLDVVGLPSGVKIKTMSRGMKQRLGIAGVLVNDPDVVLLDEPTSALDPAGRNDVMNILLHLKKEGKTIILSTHILADMDKICDKAGFLSKGVIVREEELKKHRQQVNSLRVIFRESVELTGLSDKFSYLTDEDLSKRTADQGEKDNSKIQIEKIDKCTYIFTLDEKNRAGSQQLLFLELGRLGHEIISINPAIPSLDKIFQEVCL